ncbi:kinase [Saccharopolyspora hirsuta]|uniref:Kinase n=1 Tax=Saccharopolyspora hirsuta TaxID=1837 RepID=A0A5M7BUG6_SACHI|nr:kinase [Saccharopolyspora hirsuta]KAA5831798.1 kinase [Saccharopolyspora hirsuta]
MGSVGSAATRLVVLRGNSASGKTSTALAVRAQLGRTCALVQQDVLRRTVLKERDVPGGFNIGLISTVARYALDHGYHVIVEGILSAERYTAMLTQLADDHRGATWFYYLDVPFAETVRRHGTRPQAAEFGEQDMREWYRPGDLLGLPGEQVIPASSALEETAARILAEVFGAGPTR